MESASGTQRARLLDPLPIRFRETTARRLKSASQRFSLSASEIVRRAVEEKLPEWERTGALVITETK